MECRWHSCRGSICSSPHWKTSSSDFNQEPISCALWSWGKQLKLCVEWAHAPYKSPQLCLVGAEQWSIVVQAEPHTPKHDEKWKHGLFIMSLRMFRSKYAGHENQQVCSTAVSHNRICFSSYLRAIPNVLKQKEQDLLLVQLRPCAQSCQTSCHDSEDNKAVEHNSSA